MRRFASRPIALLATALIGSTALPALAQTVDRIVAFGDSYADNGNLFRITGQPFPAPYPTGRFSGGTNFVDTLTAFYGATQVNNAIGGSQAGPTNVVGVGIPGFQQQWQGFVASGATLSSTDIVAISIGGNDARAYAQGGGTTGGAAAAAGVTAGQAAAGVNAIVGRGAKTLVFLTGDTGQLPEFIPNPAGAAVATAFSNAYNAQIKTTLATVAAGGVQVAYVDGAQILTQVKANPTAYGLTNVTTTCPVPACLANPSLQSQYLFYVDGVHLTSAGFEIIGRYAIRMVQAPYGLRQQADVPQRTAQGFSNALGARLDVARGRSSEGAKPFAIFGQIEGQSGSRRGNAGGSHYKYDSRGATIGVERSADGVVLGAAFSYQKPKGDANRDGTRTRGDSYFVGLFGGFAGDNLFVQGQASYGWHKLDFRREGVITPVSASADAKSITAAARAGYLIGGDTRIGPVVGIAYARTKVDGYTETGDAALALNVGSQKATAITGSLGIEARHRFGGSGVSPYLRVTAEKDLKGDGRTVRYASTTAANVVNGFVIPDDSKRVYGAVAGGMSVAITQAIALDLNVGATFSHKTGNDAQGLAAVRVAF